MLIYSQVNSPPSPKSEGWEAEGIYPINDSLARFVDASMGSNRSVMAADRQDTTTASTGSRVQKGLLESNMLTSNNADKERGPGALQKMDSEGRQNFSRERREPALEGKETAHIPEFSRGILIVDSAEQGGLLDADEV